MRFWRTLDRLAAWVLLVGMTLYFLTGYGMSKGIIDANFATLLHTEILPIPIAVAFLIHGGYATRLALIRWKAWRWPGQIAWASFLILFLFASLFLDRVYRIPAFSTSPTAAVETTVASPTMQISAPSPSPSSEPVALAEAGTSQPVAQVEAPASQPPTQTSVAERTFTQSELAQYNGRNGNPAYVAVNGAVYDLSRVFRSGTHFSHQAGQELTDAFYMRHAIRAITKYPVVGVYLG